MIFARQKKLYDAGVPESVEEFVAMTTNRFAFMGIGRVWYSDKKNLFLV